MHFPTSISLTALTLTLLTPPSTAQQSSVATTTSSFNWDSLISAAATSLSSFDLYTTNASLGPGELDTRSHGADLYSSVAPTPVVGPIGNGTVANGTVGNGTVTRGGGAGGAGPTGSEGSASEGAPQATGNGGVGGRGGLWGEGAGVVVGFGVVMAAL